MIRTKFNPFGAGSGSKADSYLAEIIKNHPNLVTGEPDYTTAETGWHIYKLTTALGDTYCFRGNGDNYFSMGIYSGWGGSDILFRIIRVNEDGSVRMIAHDYDVNGRPAIPVGVPDYDLLRGGSATGFYDDWFINKTNLTDYYNAGIVIDEPFYWDMSNNNAFPFADYYMNLRLRNNNPAPKLYDTAWLPSGEFKGYVWSANNAILERRISTPCGIITGDEIVIGGVVPNVQNSNFAVQNSKGYESICGPCQWLPTFGIADTLRYYVSIGNLGSLRANGGNKAVIRPVINIKGDIEVIGSGTISDPWMLKNDPTKE